MKQNDMAQRLKSLEKSIHDLRHESELAYTHLKEETESKVDALASLITLLRIEMQRLTQSVSQLQQERGQNENRRDIKMDAGGRAELEEQWLKYVGNSQGGVRIKDQASTTGSTAVSAEVVVSTRARDLQSAIDNLGNLLQDNRATPDAIAIPNATQASVSLPPAPFPEPVPNQKVAKQGKSFPASNGILHKSTKLALLTAKCVIPSPIHSMLEHASTKVLDHVQDPTTTLHRTVRSLSDWFPTSFELSEATLPPATQPHQKQRPTLPPRVPRYPKSHPRVPANSTITLLPSRILVQILIYTVKPLQSNVGLHILEWYNQRIHLLHLKALCKSLNPLISQTLTIIDSRDVHDSSAIPQKPISGLTYRRQLHLQPTDISQHVHTRRQIVLSTKTPLPVFELSPSETIYASPRQYFRCERVASSPTRSQYTLRIRTLVDAAKVSASAAQPVTMQFKIHLDNTTRTASLRLNLTDDVIRTTQLNLHERDPEGKEPTIVEVCHRVRRDLEASIQANPVFRDTLDPPTGLMTAAMGLATMGLRASGVLGPVVETKRLTVEERGESFDKWVRMQRKGKVWIVYNVDLTEMVVPTNCLFGGFFA
ncbi:hypothetical protein HDU98_009770 [Podochytrium sp. JEL0797]|nr:hypothetical protein HDU98_009770 [Podochytrium sp. JEL0797]